MSNVAESTGTFAARDGTRIFYRAWKPAIKPIATILIIHGLGEHSGRYLHVGRYFAENAIQTFALDLRGHGRSGGKPMFIRNYSELSMDLVDAIEHLAGTPTFLFGHSFGAQLLLWTMRKNRPSVHGLIISAPWLGLVRQPPKWQTTFVERLNRPFPGIRIVTGIRPDQLSSDQAHLDTLKDHDLSRNYITVRLYVEAVKAAAEVMQMESLAVPILIAQGTADSVTSADNVRQFFERLQCGDKHCIIYKGFRHELHNETDRLLVLEAYLGWMKDRCG